MLRFCLIFVVCDIDSMSHLQNVYVSGIARSGICSIAVMILWCLALVWPEITDTTAKLQYQSVWW